MFMNNNYYVQSYDGETSIDIESINVRNTTYNNIYSTYFVSWKRRWASAIIAERVSVRQLLRVVFSRYYYYFFYYTHQQVQMKRERMNNEEDRVV